MKEFGAIGDNDIQFRELKSNDDIKELFEHFTIIIRETRQAAVVTAQGAVMMQQTREIDLTNGAFSGATSVFGLGIESGNNANTITNENITTYSPPKKIEDNRKPIALTPDNRVKEVPSTLSHFWDDSYDLNAYELKALYGSDRTIKLIHYRIFMMTDRIYINRVRCFCCCCQCCCQCCCLPGTLDHCCIMLPSTTIGTCIVEDNWVTLLCAPCIAVPFIICCPCFYVKMCTTSLAITNEGYTHRYE